MSLRDVVLRPEFLPALAAVPATWFALVALDRRRARAFAAVAGPRAKVLGREASESRRAGARTLFALGLLLALVAATSPALGSTVADLEARGADVVVCLDVSRSMLARDTFPDRLTRAKREIASLAARARGDRLALVVFAGEARALVPLTADTASYTTLAETADPSSVARGGTDLGAALEVALALLGRRGPGPAAVVLLTDGEDLSGHGLAVADKFAERGIPVHAVALGTALGGKIGVTDARGPSFVRDREGREVVTTMDAASLRRITERTGGTFTEVGPAGTPLADVHEKSIVPAARSLARAEGRRRLEDRFQWPLLAAVACFLLGLARSVRVRERTVTVAPPSVGRAALARAAVVALVVLVGGCDASSEGRKAYREGRTREALAAFEKEISARGDGASQELLYDAALAALREGEFEKAVAAANRAGDRGGAAIAWRAAFVRGNVAFARSVSAEADAARPGGDPTSMERARAFAEDALAAWRYAAEGREDRPAARRNVERALLRLDRLREKKSGTGGRDAPPGGKDGPSATDRPPTPREPDPKEPLKDAGEAVVTSELPADRVLLLFDLLRAKEKAKQELRRGRWDRANPGVEKDW